MLIFVAVTSCSTEKTWNQGDIKNVRSIIEEFDIGDVLIGRSARMIITGDSLFIMDEMSVDKIVKVFQIPTGEFIGEFVNYGEGPSEVGGPDGLNVFYDEGDGRKKALITNYSQNAVLIFDVDSALNMEKYSPKRICGFKSGLIPSHYVYTGDAMGFARKIILSPSGNGFDQELCRFNISTGEITDFAQEYHIDNNSSVAAVSLKHDLVAEASSNVDLINIYDFDGRLLHAVKGSEYQDKADRRKSYFSNVVFADSLILGVYSGGSWNKQYIGKKIAVIDIEGNYVGTLDTERKIRDLKYHDPSGTLYLSLLDDDWQFGTLDLKKALKETIIEPKQSSSVKKPNSTGIITGRPPVNFLNVAQKGAFGDENDTIPGKMLGDIELLPQVDSSYLVFRKLSLGVNRYKNSPDTIRIDSVKLTPDFLKLDLSVKEFIDVAIMDVELGFPQNAPLGPFDGRVEIYVAGYSEPSVLKIKGTISRMAEF